MALTTVVTLNKGGTDEVSKQAGELTIPDLWHLAEDLARRGDKRAAEAVLECWSLCHDLLRHVQESPAQP